MLRFIWFLLLLFAGCALIFWPYHAQNSPSAVYSSRLARPSTRPLPNAWKNGSKLELHPLVDQAASSALASDRECGETYTVRPADTLGEIARRCGVSLVDLLAVNTQLRNPNRILAGQTLIIPRTAGGGIPDTASRPEFFPGGEVEIVVGGLPPNQAVRIGLGLSSVGYRVLDRVVTGPDGTLSARITLPADASPGDSAFLMVTTQTVPASQAISETFIITNP